ncbi:hypothetical protein MKX03_007933 [Papaver bracteatum]|nr:hypothetical protein MKX03_007933 [Papaver bracteatum]
MNTRKGCYMTIRISLKLLVGDDHEVGLVGSCNGLICLSSKRRYNKPVNITYHNSTYDESIYIYNPIIGEVMSIRSNNNKKYTVHGFGYHPLTNEYKVVKNYFDEPPYSGKPPYKGQVEVYTLGSGSGWRNKGEIN